MNLGEITTEVARVLKRPDKTADIIREVNAAILFCCSDGVGFSEDLVEQAMPMDPTKYSQELDLILLEGFRKFYYLRVGTGNHFLEKVTPKNVFQCGTTIQNGYYTTGSILHIRTSVLATHLAVAYFKYPKRLESPTDTYWMTDVSPYMIIDRVLAKLFSNIGDDASARIHESYFRTAWLAFRDDQGIDG